LASVVMVVMMMMMVVVVVVVMGGARTGVHRLGLSEPFKSTVLVLMMIM
jgi:hypothetical protein